MQDNGNARLGEWLQHQGLHHPGKINYNLSAAALYEQAVARGEGMVAQMGPLVVRTGEHTGRSPNDKFIVREPSCESKVWWGKSNRPIAPEKFDALYSRVMAYLQGRELFVRDCRGGADPQFQMPLRVVTETAWHNLFAHYMFLPVPADQVASHEPEYTVIHAPNFKAVPALDGTNSETFIILNFARKIILIGGTQYAGEMKKSVFTLLNYLLPQQNVMSMHCSANIAPDGQVAIFFGLSGTGKTTLSADPERILIGDDEHGWGDNGVFNFEGGCYAKVIRLSAKAEPEIYATTRTFATILENVVLDPATRELDLDSEALTENTRAAYPVAYIPNIAPSGKGGHPTNIIMLTCDAFGVMPPIARLTAEQAMYHFLSGYTARVAGTERGMGKEPQATFSTCFGAPFMALDPTVYAHLLREKIARTQAKCWLVNTGWSGGPYGVGERMSIAHTRALVRAALNGDLDHVPMEKDPFFGVEIPARCEGVPSEVLFPRNIWQDKEAYDKQARELVAMFEKNFQQFADAAAKEIQEVALKVAN